MALVRVVSLSGNVQIVPRSVYDSQLKKKGYMLYNDISKQRKKDTPADDEDFNKEDVSVEESSEEEVDIESIPVGEMTGKQLKEYANLKGIDVSAAKSTREARDIVREWIQENGD